MLLRIDMVGVGTRHSLPGDVYPLLLLGETVGDTIYGIPIMQTELLPDCCSIITSGRIGYADYRMYRLCTTGEHTKMKTFNLDAGVTVPVEVASDAVATAVLTVLKRELERAAKKAVADFVAHGAKAALGDVAVRAEKSLISAK